MDNPQGNSPVEKIHQVVQNMIKTKEINNFVFDYIDPWAEVLYSVACAIQVLYESTLKPTLT